MKELLASVLLGFLMLFAIIMIIQAFRKKPSKVGPALKDSINRFS